MLLRRGVTLQRAIDYKKKLGIRLTSWIALFCLHAIKERQGMVYSAVGCTPAFMVAAAGSIPALSICPFFRAGSALEREC